MKSINIIILFFLVLGKNSIAQNNQSNSIPMDPRIEKHFSEAEINRLKEMPLVVKKLNYYFRDSYIVVPSTMSDAEPIDLMAIDARDFENQRHPTERKTIIISKYDDTLVLKSKEEVEKEYDKIMISKN